MMPGQISRVLENVSSAFRRVGSITCGKVGEPLYSVACGLKKKAAEGQSDNLLAASVGQSVPSLDV